MTENLLLLMMWHPHSFVKTKSYWSAKIDKLQQLRGLETRKSTRIICLNLERLYFHVTVTKSNGQSNSLFL